MIIGVILGIILVGLGVAAVNSCKMKERDNEQVVLLSDIVGEGEEVGYNPLEARPLLSTISDDEMSLSDIPSYSDVENLVVDSEDEGEEGLLTEQDSIITTVEQNYDSSED